MVRFWVTGRVEVMEQTYYHSLASLYEEKSEFFEEVKMHRELIWDIFGMRPPYVIGGAGAGSPLLTIGIPLAVTSEPVLVGIQAYVRELARTRYAHYPNEATLAEQIKSSIQSGDLRLTDSHYPVFTGGPPDRMRKD